MRKKGQIPGQVFIYILALVIVAGVLFFGYRGIVGVSDKGDDVVLTQFETRLKGDVMALKTDFGSVKKFNYNLPTGVSKVCVHNKEAEMDEIGAKIIDKYPLVQEAIETDMNMFLLNDEGNLEKSYNIGDVVISSDAYFTCFDTSEGKLNIALEGKGKKTMMVTKFETQTSLRSDEPTVLESADEGLVLEIPPGAANVPDVSIEVVDDEQNPISSMTAIGEIYRLEPSGTSFSPPVTVTVDYNPNLNCPSSLVYLLISDNGNIEQIPVPAEGIDCENYKASFELDHFSFLTIGCQSDSDCSRITGNIMTDCNERQGVCELPDTPTTGGGAVGVDICTNSANQVSGNLAVKISYDELGGTAYTDGATIRVTKLKEDDSGEIECSRAFIITSSDYDPNNKFLIENLPVGDNYYIEYVGSIVGYQLADIGIGVSTTDCYDGDTNKPEYCKVVIGGSCCFTVPDSPNIQIELVIEEAEADPEFGSPPSVEDPVDYTVTKIERTDDCYLNNDKHYEIGKCSSGTLLVEIDPPDAGVPIYLYRKKGDSVEYEGIFKGYTDSEGKLENTCLFEAYQGDNCNVYSKDCEINGVKTFEGLATRSSNGAYSDIYAKAGSLDATASDILEGFTVGCKCDTVADCTNNDYTCENGICMPPASEPPPSGTPYCDGSDVEIDNVKIKWCSTAQLTCTDGECTGTPPNTCQLTKRCTADKKYVQVNCRPSSSLWSNYENCELQNRICDETSFECKETDVTVCEDGSSDTCDDGNECTNDYCEFGSCVNNNKLPGSACTGGTCQNGICTGSDGNPSSQTPTISEVTTPVAPEQNIVIRGANFGSSKGTNDNVKINSPSQQWINLICSDWTDESLVCRIPRKCTTPSGDCVDPGDFTLQVFTSNGNSGSETIKIIDYYYFKDCDCSARDSECVTNCLTTWVNDWLQEINKPNFQQCQSLSGSQLQQCIGDSVTSWLTLCECDTKFQTLASNFLSSMTGDDGEFMNCVNDCSTKKPCTEFNLVDSTGKVQLAMCQASCPSAPNAAVTITQKSDGLCANGVCCAYTYDSDMTLPDCTLSNRGCIDSLELNLPICGTYSGEGWLQDCVSEWYDATECASANDKAYCLENYINTNAESGTSCSDCGLWCTETECNSLGETCEWIGLGIGVCSSITA